MNTILECLESGSHDGGRVSVIGHEETSAEYPQLLEEGMAMAGHLVHRGIRPGDVIAIVALTSIDFLRGCMAAWYAGGTVMPLPLSLGMAARSSRWAENTAGLLERLGVKVVLTSSAHPRVPTTVTSIAIDDLSGARPESRVEIDPQTPALIQFTSGATSSPRPVVISHATFASYRAAQLAVTHEQSNGDHLLSWLPLYHDMGLVAHSLVAMTVGMPLTLIDTKLFLEDPRRWLTESSDRGATVLGAPNFAYGLLNRWVNKGLSEDLDLSKVRILSSGAEPIDIPTSRTAIETLGRYGLDERAFTPCYGLAEATCAVTIRGPGAGLAVDRVDRQELAGGRATAAGGEEGVVQVAAVGKPLPGVRLRIEGASSDRTVGEVMIAGPTLMNGYFDDPEASRTAFDGEWLRSGDLGYLIEDELRIVGRVKDTIIVRGQNFFAEDIERIVHGVEGIRVGRCAAVGISTGETEEIAVVTETRLSTEEEKDECRKAVLRRVWEETGVSPKHIFFVEAGTVPKTSSGKLQRTRVRSMVRELVGT
jgi:acyl-CoA synthetase (AMP-forming)/AMP-acid ligase II